MSEAVTDSIISVESVLIEAPRIDVIELITADSVTDSINTVEVTEAVIVETIESESIVVEIVEVAQQGPRGLQGIPGPAGGSTVALTAGENLSGHRAISSHLGLAYYCDAMDITHVGTAIGVSTGAALLGDTVYVQTLGNLIEPSWNWSDGPIFVGNNGQLTQTITGLFMQQIGVAVNQTEMNINPQLAVMRI